MATIKELAVKLTADIKPFKDAMGEAEKIIVDFEKTQKKSSKSQIANDKEIAKAKKDFANQQKKLLNELSAEGKRLSDKEIKEKKQLSGLILKQSRATGAEQKKIKKEVLDKELQLIKTTQKKERQIMKDQLNVVKGNEQAEFKIKEKFAQKEIQLSKKVATQTNKIEREAGKTRGKAAQNKFRANLEVAENATTALGGLLKGQFTPMAAMVGGPWGAAVGLGIDLLSGLGKAAFEAGKQFIDFNNTVANLATTINFQNNVELTTVEIDKLKVQIMAIQKPLGVTTQDMAKLSMSVASFEKPDKIIETTEAIGNLFRIGKGEVGLDKITAGVSRLSSSLGITGKEAADLAAILAEELKGKTVDPLGESLTELATITSKANLVIGDGAKAGRESISVYKQMMKTGFEVGEATSATEEVFLALNDVITDPKLKEALTKSLPEGMSLLDAGIEKGNVSAVKFIDFMQRGGEATKQFATLLPSTAGEAIQGLQAQFERSGKSINDFAVSQDSVANASKNLAMAFSNLKEQQMEKLADRADSMTLQFGKHMADAIEGSRNSMLGMADAMASADFSGFLRDVSSFIPMGGILEGIVDLFVDSAVEAEKAFKNYELLAGISDNFNTLNDELQNISDGEKFLAKLGEDMDTLKGLSPGVASSIEKLANSANATDPSNIEAIKNHLEVINTLKSHETMEALKDSIAATGEEIQDLADESSGFWEDLTGFALDAIGATVSFAGEISGLNDMLIDSDALVQGAFGGTMQDRIASTEEEINSITEAISNGTLSAEEQIEATEDLNELYADLNTMRANEAKMLDAGKRLLEQQNEEMELLKSQTEGNLSVEAQALQIENLKTEQLEQQNETFKGQLDILEQVKAGLAEEVALLNQIGPQMESIADKTAREAEEKEKAAAAAKEQLATQQAINAELDSELDTLILAGETEEERLTREKALLETKKEELQITLAELEALEDTVENQKKREKLAKAITSIDRQIAKLDKPDKKVDKKKEKVDKKREQKRAQVEDRSIKARESEIDKINKAAEDREKAEKAHQEKIKAATENIKKAATNILMSSAKAVEDIVRDRFQPTLKELMEEIGADPALLNQIDDTTKQQVEAAREADKTETERLKTAQNTAVAEKQRIEKELEKFKPLVRANDALIALKNAELNFSRKQQNGLQNIVTNILVNMSNLDDSIKGQFQDSFILMSKTFGRTNVSVSRASDFIDQYTEALSNSVTKLDNSSNQIANLNKQYDIQQGLLNELQQDISFGIGQGGAGQAARGGEKARAEVTDIDALTKAAKQFQLILRLQDEITTLQEEMLTATPEQMTELQIDLEKKITKTSAALRAMNTEFDANTSKIKGSTDKTRDMIDSIVKLKKSADNTAQGIKEFGALTEAGFTETIAKNTESVNQFNDFIGGNFEKLNEKQFLFNSQKLENEIETNEKILFETKIALQAQEDILEARKIRAIDLGDIAKIAKTEKELRGIGSQLANIAKTEKELADVKPDILSKERMKDAGNAIMKVGSIVSNSVDSIMSFQDALQEAETPSEKVMAGAELAQNVGSALMKSKIPQLALIGAFIVGAAMITKAVAKITQAIGGREQTSLEIAEARAEKEDRLRSIQDARIGIMEKLVELGQRNLDQATEQLAMEREINQARREGSEIFDQFSQMTAEDLAKTISDMTDSTADIEENIAKATEALSFDRKGRREFLNTVGREVKTTTDTTESLEKFIAQQEAALSEVTTDIGLANDALEFQQLLQDRLSQIIEEEIGLLQFKNRLNGESLDNLKEQSAIRKTALNDILTEVDLTGKTNEEIKEILDNTEDLSGPIIEVAEAWLDSIDAVEQYRVNLDKINGLLNKQKTILGLNRDLGNITADEHKAGMLKILEQQLQIRVDEYDTMLLQNATQEMLLDNEIDRLGIELEIKNLMEEQGDAADKVLINLIRQHQQRLKQVRAGQADPSQTAKLRDDMVVRLRDQGKSEEFIQNFLDSLPKFEKGGFVNTTEPALLHAGELVLPADFVSKLENIQQSPFTFEPEKSPLNLFNTPEAKIFNDSIARQNNAQNAGNNVTINIDLKQDFDISGTNDPVQLVNQLKSMTKNDLIATVQKAIESGELQLKR